MWNNEAVDHYCHVRMRRGGVYDESCVCVQLAHVGVRVCICALHHSAKEQVVTTWKLNYNLNGMSLLLLMCLLSYTNNVWLLPQLMHTYKHTGYVLETM